ncbi:MAG: DUF2148 domain-containing protein [Desulfurococcaceae archaeon]
MGSQSLAQEEAEALRRGVLAVAELMAVSAKTAPKARGVDNVVVKILSSREDLERLARKMEELADEYGEFFRRDARSVRDSDAVVLVGCKIVEMGLKGEKRFGMSADLVNCLVNLGIAIGSAVKTASLLNVDNRVMYSAGMAALEAGMIDAFVAYGIPLSARAKNIYFDRRA